MIVHIFCAYFRSVSYIMSGMGTSQTQCLVNVGPTSTTLAQHYPNLGLVFIGEKAAEISDAYRPALLTYTVLYASSLPCCIYILSRMLTLEI